MHIFCTQENLRKALMVLERVVGKQSSLPILSNILIETKNGQLQLSATNLEIGVVVSIGVKIEKEGKVTVPAKLLTTFINNLPESQILELRAEGVHLFVKSDRYQVQLKGLDTKDFPIIPVLQGKYELTLPAQIFREALQKTLFCVSLNESRMELTGVNVQFLDRVMAVAATDSFRLGEYKVQVNDVVEGGIYESFQKKNQTLLIPSSTLQELVRIIDSESGLLEIAVAENQLFFRVDGVSLVSRLLQGRYPDYQQIIPKSFTNTITLKKEDFLRALKMSSSFSNLHSGEVKFSLSKEKKELVVVAESQDVGKNETSLDFQGEIREDQVFVFNPRYILEGVAALTGEMVDCLYNSPTTPVLFQESKEESPYLYIVMPIRK